MTALACVVGAAVVLLAALGLAMTMRATTDQQARRDRDARRDRERLTEALGSTSSIRDVTAADVNDARRNGGES